MDGRQQCISIGDLSMRTEVNIETIRYYEKIGLLPAPGGRGAAPGYGPAHSRDSPLCAGAVNWALALEEIRSPSETCRRRPQLVLGRAAVTLKHLEDVRKKIADLQRLERTLSEVASRCQGGSVPDCPIVEALYAPAHSADA